MNEILKKTSIVILFIILISNVFSQNNMIYGYIYDEYSNEPMVGVNVHLDSTYYTYSDINGYFKFSNVTIGKHLVKATCIGYYVQEKKINVDSQDNEFNLIFLLNYGPQFSKSMKFNVYHTTLKNLYNNDHSIFRIKPTNIENDNFKVNISFDFINDSDESIFVTKFNFGIYISDSLGNEILYVPQYIGSIDFFYVDNDLIEIN